MKVKEEFGLLGFDHVVEDEGRRNEYWITNNKTAGYCGKFLEFLPEKKSSAHYHRNKHECFFVLSGRVFLRWSYADNPDDMELEILDKGDKFDLPSGMRHQIEAGPNGAVIIEFSSYHEDSDTYRLRGHNE